MAASIVIAALAVPFFGEGLRTVSTGDPATSGLSDRWMSLVRIMLALSGVEAVSNMTGLMKQPVSSTAKKTIWPVLCEVVLFNIFFGIALAGLPVLRDLTTPDFVTHGATSVPGEVREYRDTAMRVLAIAAGQNAFGATAGFVVGKIASIIFGLLLLSATNTAIMAMVSVMYSMARDREMPQVLARLNYSGVPRWGLVAACLAPCCVLLFVQDVALLAELYAVGVVGAITINVLSCAANKRLEIRRWERFALAAIGLLMLGVEVTIVVTKWHATVFAGGLVAVVLASRYLISRRAKAMAALPEPETGWLAEIRQAPVKLEPGRPRIMLAARGRDNAEFAIDLARKRGAALFAIYVRTLRVMDVRPGQLPRIEDDAEAQETLGTAAVLAREAGVPYFPIYITASDIADEVLDYTVTFGCDTLIVGQSRRAVFARAMAGDVVSRIAQHLPEGVSLIKRSTRFIPGPAFSPAPAADPASANDEPPPS
jgi:nucleotide-binding universal stress UspA family protein